MKKLILLLSVISLNAFAASTSAPTGNANQALARFDKSLSALESLLSQSGSSPSAVEALINSPDARIAAFDLQALGKLYASRDALFQNMRKDFKSIEDGIGTIDKWTSLNNAKKLEKAKNEFADQLTQNSWIAAGASPKIKDYRRRLSQLRWSTSAEERSFLMDVLSEQIEKVVTTEYDFGHLEEGNGLHEYRREIRWFMMEAKVLNGLVTFNSSPVCPTSSLNWILTDKVAKSKYATLPPNKSEPTPCLISRCYFIDAARMVEEIGKLKDKAEQAIGNTDSDETPKEIKRDAEKAAKQFSDNGSLESLITEIRACR